MKNNYLLTDSLASSISVYLMLKKLTSDFEDWDAYKIGIIDKNGNKIKEPITAKERETWDILTRFCCNIKKLSMKFIGKSKFSQYFTAAYLLKDSITPFYINKNKQKLDESLLSDITYSKQLCIYNIIKLLPKEKCVKEDMLEIMMFKYLQEVESVIKSNEQLYQMFDIFEDSVQADVAGVDSLLFSGGQKIDSRKFVKKDLRKILKSKKKGKHNNEDYRQGKLR